MKDCDNQKARSFELAGEAIKRGGAASWFNRLRSSLNRAKSEKTKAGGSNQMDYAAIVTRAFDDHLEQFADKDRIKKHCKKISDGLASDKHQQFAEALELLGKLLGYQASRPKGKAVTDNRWRGIFAQTREVITFEAKIEHVDVNAITPTHMGQAHNQLNRAMTEFGQLGFGVRGTIITHLNEIEASARASAGAIRIIPKSAMAELWNRIEKLFRAYAKDWSLDDPASRQPPMKILQAKCPAPGWFFRALDGDELFISSASLLKEWKA